MPESLSPSTAKSQALYRRAKQIIPGGTQLLSKRPEMFAPDQWPAYFRSACGCEIVDLDGNTYLDMSTNGVGSCLLGYADPDVTAAVVRRVQDGSMCSLNPPEEVELAELLLKLHPWAEQARFFANRRRSHGGRRPHRAGHDRPRRRCDLRLSRLARLVPCGQPSTSRASGRIAIASFAGAFAGWRSIAACRYDVHVCIQRNRRVSGDCQTTWQQSGRGRHGANPQC